jgi:hypothetical protein
VSATLGLVLQDRSSNRGYHHRQFSLADFAGLAGYLHRVFGSLCFMLAFSTLENLSTGLESGTDKAVERHSRLQGHEDVYMLSSIVSPFSAEVSKV